MDSMRRRRRRKSSWWWSLNLEKMFMWQKKLKTQRNILEVRDKYFHTCNLFCLSKSTWRSRHWSKWSSRMWEVININCLPESSFNWLLTLEDGTGTNWCFYENVRIYRTTVNFVYLYDKSLIMAFHCFNWLAQLLFNSNGWLHVKYLVIKDVKRCIAMALENHGKILCLLWGSHNGRNNSHDILFLLST